MTLRGHLSGTESRRREETPSEPLAPIVHDRVLRTIHLGGRPAVAAYPAIPARWARSFEMYLWDQAQGGARRADALSDFVLQFGCWEGFETLLAMAVLDGGDRRGLVVDFGAHLGWYSLLAASFGYRTLALDEDAEQLEMLKESARLNALDGLIVPRKLRVDVKLGTLDFDALCGPTDELCAAEVRASEEASEEGRGSDTAEGAAATAIAWMKLDIEGAEAEAMRASWSYFERRLVRAAHIEITPAWACWIDGQIDFLRRLAALGYELYDIPAPGPGHAAAFAANPLRALRDHRVDARDLEAHLRPLHQTNFLVLRPEGGARSVETPSPSGGHVRDTAGLTLGNGGAAEAPEVRQPTGRAASISAAAPGGTRTIAALSGAEVQFFGSAGEIDNLVQEVVTDNGYRLDHGSFSRTGVALDLGANVGLFALWAAAKGARRVICYEPHPETFSLLIQNIASNGWRFPNCQFETRQLAVAGEAGVVRLYGTSTAARLGSGSPWDAGIDVESIAIEELWEGERLDEIDVLKMDIEGAEYAIFASAPEGLWRKAERITLEFHEAREAADWGLMLSRLSISHRLETIGDPRRGGMLWARRY